jgi:hypothetical protein
MIKKKSLSRRLYLAIPKEIYTDIYTISSGIGVTAAIIAAFQPYF